MYLIEDEFSDAEMAVVSTLSGNDVTSFYHVWLQEVFEFNLLVKGGHVGSSSWMPHILNLIVELKIMVYVIIGIILFGTQVFGKFVGIIC